MMRMITAVGVGLGLVALACSPNTESEGSTGDSSGSPADTDPMASTSASPMTSGVETDAADDDPSSGGSSSGEACDDPETMVLWAADGEVLEPMMLVPSPQLGDIEFARSWATDSGSITLRFELECGGPVYAWGLVYDRHGGNLTENPDSFHFAFDDDSEAIWSYGCDTPIGQFVWRWAPIATWIEMTCDHDPLMLELQPGMHAVALRNREPGSGDDAAGIAAVVVSHSPDVDLTEFFDPATIE